MSYAFFRAGSQLSVLIAASPVSFWTILLPSGRKGISCTMPRSDSSETYMRAVRPWPSPADLLSGWTAGVFEVSRFSCMKFLGVLWGLRLRQTEQRLALTSLSMLPAAITRASASGLHLFGAQYPPHLFPCLRFVAYLATGLTQNSGPSGSLLLSREKFSFSASCRFSPAL